MFFFLLLRLNAKIILHVWKTIPISKTEEQRYLCNSPASFAFGNCSKIPTGLLGGHLRGAVCGILQAGA